MSLDWRLVKKANLQCWRAWLANSWPYVGVPELPMTSIEFDIRGTLYRMEGRTRIRVGNKR